MEPKHQFFLTFGQKSPLRHGWVEIEASTEEDAKEAAEYAFGQSWSNIYPTPLFDIGSFPAGKFGETLIGK